MAKRSNLSKNPSSSEKSLRSELVGQMLNLTTSGFGLVAALAWNEAIQNFVNTYIQNYFQSYSGLISKFIYAILITLLAVTITYQLSKLAAHLQSSKK